MINYIRFKLLLNEELKPLQIVPIVVFKENKP